MKVIKCLSILCCESFIEHDKFDIVIVTVVIHPFIVIQIHMERPSINPPNRYSFLVNVFLQLHVVIRLAAQDTGQNKYKVLRERQNNDYDCI